MSILTSTALLKGVAALSLGGFIAFGGVSNVTTDASDLVSIQDNKKMGTISGVVKDPEGQPAPKVPIVLAVPNVLQGPAPGGSKGLSMNAVNQPTSGKNRFKTVAKAVSDDEGKFKFPKPLEPGTYRVEAGKKDYAYTATSVTVKAGEEAKLDIKLRKGAKAKR